MAESTSYNVCKSSSFTNHHFLLNFLFKGGTTDIKRDSMKTSLRDIFQADLRCLIRFCEGIIKYFEAPN